VHKQFGYKSAAMTLDVCGHLWPDDTERLAEHMDRAHEEALTRLARTQDGPTVVPLQDAAGQWAKMLVRAEGLEPPRVSPPGPKPA
jgi:hypothetical protein